MRVTFSIIKAFLWIVVGVFFGVAAFFLIFAFQYVYGNPVDLGKYINYEFIMYLCVALLAGASADYGNYPHRGLKRIMPLIGTFFLLFLLFIVFNPAVPQRPLEYIVKGMAIAYSVISFTVCMILKARMFFEECENINPIRF